jgi:hypothetical protein
MNIAHYAYWVHRYHHLRKAIVNAPLVIQRMRTSVKSKLMSAKIAAGMKNPKVTQEEITSGVELEDVTQYAEIRGWEGRLPVLPYDLLIVHMLSWPFAILKSIWWLIRWIVNNKKILLYFIIFYYILLYFSRLVGIFFDFFFVCFFALD